MEIVNLTGQLHIVWTKEFPAKGNVKLSQSIIELWEVDWVRIIKSTFWDAVLPAPSKDVGYLVSHIVCQKFPERDDLYIVWGKYKNEQWQVIWASHLIFNPYYNDMGKK